MEEIKIGEYVRNKKGYIGKVIKIRKRIETYKNDREAYLVDWCGKRATYISQIKDIKHSSNPIDLIEVGDYVNGYKVRATYLDGARHYIKLESKDEKGTRVYDEDIKSIVTHEQFAQIEYKVEE